MSYGPDFGCSFFDAFLVAPQSYDNATYGGGSAIRHSMSSISITPLEYTKSIHPPI